MTTALDRRAWGDVVPFRCCGEAPSGRAYWGGGGSSPVGPRGPVGPDGTLNTVLEPLEHSVLDHDDPTGQHADPAGQHAFIQGVLEPLEHLVLDVDLDGPESSGTVGAFSSGRCWPG